MEARALAGQSQGVADGGVLRPGVAVMNQVRSRCTAAFNDTPDPRPSPRTSTKAGAVQSGGSLGSLGRSAVLMVMRSRDRALGRYLIEERAGDGPSGAIPWEINFHRDLV